MTEEDRVRLRHTDRWVGALVLVTVGIFLAFAVQRSVIREWFAGGVQLTVLMPEEGGVAGLSPGSEAEVLGIRAGSVRRVVVAPEGRIRAELLIEDQVRNFIRTDSVATVRRRFGVAGPAYLDIARGEGAPLDWGRHAVIEARVEAAATETAGALLEDLRRRVFPILDDLQRGTRAFADSTERLAKGEGTVGRLLSDGTLAAEAEEAARRANALLATLDDAAGRIQGLAGSLSGTEGRGGPSEGSLPSVLLRADRTLALLERAARDLPRATRNVRQGTDPLPAVMVQAQQTALELERLAAQLRGHWLLGGHGGAAARDRPRPAADRVRP
jgi:phospholipid/cholesterol/gamma-HCH transport system substrate-binding protein